MALSLAAVTIAGDEPSTGLGSISDGLQLAATINSSASDATTFSVPVIRNQITGDLNEIRSTDNSADIFELS